MCKAFSCIINKNKRVTWKMGVDSHNDLIDLAGYEDNDDTERFVRVEISPANGDYLVPDKWVLKVDEETTPRWFSPIHEQLCWDAHRLWLEQLDGIIVKRKIVNPFKDVKQVGKGEVTKAHIRLLKDWDSVRCSVRDSVWGSVWYSVWDSVWYSVWDLVGGSVWGSVRDSVGGSVRGSVWDLVYAYIGSMFKLPEWKHVKHEKGVYPFQSVVDLWEQGLVPTFDGKFWRLHSGKKASVVFKISKEELQKYYWKNKC